MTAYRLVLVLLCLAGIVLPMRYFLPWLSANDWDVGAMVDAWHGNDASSGLVWDLTVSAITLTVWIVWEVARGGRRLGLAAIPAIYLIGVSLGLPLYLLIRTF